MVHLRKNRHPQKLLTLMKTIFWSLSRQIVFEGEVFVALRASQGDLEPSRATISPQSPCSLTPAVSGKTVCTIPVNRVKSGNIATQIDFILFRRTMRRLVTDVKVIPGEDVALQHQLLVCDMRIGLLPKSKRKFTPCLKVWKLKDPQTSNHFQEVFNLHVSTSAGVADGATEDIWNNIKTGLLKTTEEVCGTTQPHH